MNNNVLQKVANTQINKDLKRHIKTFQYWLENPEKQDVLDLRVPLEDLKRDILKYYKNKPL